MQAAKATLNKWQPMLEWASKPSMNSCRIVTWVVAFKDQVWTQVKSKQRAHTDWTNELRRVRDVRDQKITFKLNRKLWAPLDQWRTQASHHRCRNNHKVAISNRIKSCWWFKKLKQLRSAKYHLRGFGDKLVNHIKYRLCRQTMSSSSSQRSCKDHRLSISKIGSLGRMCPQTPN